jgi:tetratricopeptide (TPR) repeat protein
MLTDTWLGFPLWSWLVFVAAMIIALAIVVARTLEFEGVNLTATPPFVAFRFKRKRAREETKQVSTNPSAGVAPDVSASGERSVAIGGDASHATIITGDVHLPPPEKPPRESAPPPARTTHYVHRGKIEDDVRAALARREITAVVGVAGMGGIGKTELAKHLCHELAKQQRVLWVGVYDRPLASLQDELARALGITLDPRADAASRYDTLRAAFAQNPCIVFFDDVYKVAIPHLQYLVPPSPPCAALITSRQRELGITTRMFDLDVMTEAQSLELLREAHDLGDALAREPQAAQALCQLCGYLPLALDLAASRLRKQLHWSATPIAQFNQLLTNRLRELERTQDTDPHLKSITANIALSYDALEDADQRRLRALAVFAPSGFAPRAVAAVWGESETDAWRNLERLQDESLVLHAEKAGRLRLHDLVREFAMQALHARGESDVANRAHAEFLIALFDKHYTDDVSTAPEVGDELENLREVARWARKKGEGELLARLATVPRNWLMVFSVWSEWQEWLTDALRVGIDHNRRLKANVLQALGDVQQFRKEMEAALASYREALNLYRAVGDRLGEANVRSAQARLLVRMGKVTEGEQALAQVISLRREIQDLYSEGADYGNFAYALLSIGDKTKAKAYVLKAKAVFEKIGEPSLLEWVARALAACE